MILIVGILYIYIYIFIALIKDLKSVCKSIILSKNDLIKEISN